MRSAGVAVSVLLFWVLAPADPAWGAIAAPVAYEFFWETRPASPDLPSALCADNPSQGFTAWIAPEGLRARPRGDGESAWELGLALARGGRAGQLRVADALGKAVAGNRLELHRHGVTEWYVNDERGLEQGFTLAKRPEGGTGAPLVLELTLSTDLAPRVRPGGLGLDLLEPGTPLPILRYGRLRVTDRLGREVPARLELDGLEGSEKLLRIVVDDQHAEYPLTIDPLLTTSSWSSADTDGTRAMAWGDWDGDGDLDLAAGNDAANRVYENSGGFLASVWTSPDAATLDLEWGDWDGDGDLDLAAGNDGANRVYANDGLGLPTSLDLVWSSVDSASTTSVAWGDWDGDGDLDLAVGNNGPANQVYANDGLGSPGSLVLVWTSGQSDATKSLAWADWDGDGDLDLAVGNTSDQPNRVYANDGLGLSTSLTLAWSSTETDKTEDVAWGDWDGDGDLDLAVGNWGQANRVYANDGLASPALSSVWISGDADLTVSVTWGDWDGDGDLDLAAGSNGTRRVYENDGLGTSTSLTEAWTTSATDNSQSVAWGDWDNDGDLDLAVGNRGQENRVYENRGGALASVWASVEEEPSLSMAWGDWDGDGDLDLAIGNGGPNRVYENSGGALSSAWTSADDDWTRSVAWGDWDGDGDLDLAAGNDGPNRVYENSGGALSSAWTSADDDDTTSVAWGDWDGDGDLDLAAGKWGANRVYENTGGALSSAWTSADDDETRSVAWGDWDGDGDLDLAAGNMYQGNRVYENTGGALSSAWTSADDYLTTSVAWGDWDGDGDLDLAAAKEGTGNRVFENSGGTLSFAWHALDSHDTQSVAWGDWDGDGDSDLAAGNSNNVNRIYANSGAELSSAWTSIERDYTYAVAWGDWDGDGDLDLAAANFFQGNRVYENGWIYRPDGLLSETPVFPVLALRPGTADTAFFHSTAECLTSPVAIPYTLVDEESDPARRIVAEYSLAGGGSWATATEGPGGDGTTELAASPGGTPHVFVWDSLADGVLEVDGVTFRVSVPHQASTRLPGPIQRAELAATSPPFRVCETVVDLAVAKDDGIGVVYLNDTVIWTIVVTNHGPDSAENARVTDAFPDGVAGVAWTCIAGSGASCGAPSGSGDLDVLVDLDPGSTVTFAAAGTVTGAAMWGLSNTASVTAPAGVVDSNASNDSATDTDVGWGELIFVDDFESGDTSAWTSSTP